MTETKTAVAVTTPTPKPPLLTGGKIAAIIPQDFDSAYRIANIIVKSGMAPKSLDTPEKACVAIMHGLELGLTPMAALQSIAVVNGMPTIYGDGLLALVRASGLLEDILETVEDDKDGPTIAVCKVKRVGQSSWTVHAFTRPQAMKAGLWRKQGPWTQYPQRMMQMRARSWALRDAFADVLRGLTTTEEAADMVDVTAAGSATTAPPEPRRSDYVHSGESTHDPETGEVQDTGQAATSPAAAGSDSKPEAASAPASPWKMPDDIAGQEARMKYVRAQFNDQAETVDEIDAIRAEHAEFIAKLGSKRAAFEKEIADRRLMLGGGQ